MNQGRETATTTTRVTVTTAIVTITTAIAATIKAVIITESIDKAIIAHWRIVHLTTAATMATIIVEVADIGTVTISAADMAATKIEIVVEATGVEIIATLEEVVMAVGVVTAIMHMTF